MTRTLGGTAVFAMMIVVLLGMLQLINWIPSAVQDGAFRRYRTIDDVREHLLIDPLYQPVYYPRSVQWPPSLIAAQTKPYPAVVMEFKKSGSDETALTIAQTALPYAPLAGDIRLRVIRASVSFPLKGRPAVLESGLCGDNEQCSRLHWDDGAYHLSLAMTDAPVELVRIAESMVIEKNANRAAKQRK